MINISATAADPAINLIVNSTVNGQNLSCFCATADAASYWGRAFIEFTDIAYANFLPAVALIFCLGMLVGMLLTAVVVLAKGHFKKVNA